MKEESLREKIHSLLYDDTNAWNRIIEYILLSIIMLSVIAIVSEMILPKSSKAINILVLINNAFLCFFIFEYAIRLFAHSTGVKKLVNYVFSFFGIIDLICILPFFRIFRSFRLIKLARLLRLAKLAKHKANIWTLIESVSTFFSMNSLQVLLFGVAIAFIVFSTSIILKFINPDIEFHNAFWWSLIRIIDPGFIDSSIATSFYETILSVITTLIGIVIFGLFIGLSSNLFMQYFARIQYKSRKLNLEDHYLLCNWGDDSMMKQLIEELHFHNNKAAILAEKNDLSLLDDFSPGAYHFRYGDSTNSEDLENKGAVLSAENIIVFLDTSNEYNKKNSENRTMLTLMVLKELLEKGKNAKQGKKKSSKKKRNTQLKNIVIESETTELNDWIKRSFSLDKSLNVNVIIIDKTDLIAKVLIQSGINNYLSTIYSELFTHNGQELGVLEAIELFEIMGIENPIKFVNLWEKIRNTSDDKRIKKIKKSIGISNLPLLIGKISNDKIYMNPKQKELIKENDKIIFLGDISKEHQSERLKNGKKEIKIGKKEIRINRIPKSLLIIGWNYSVSKIVLEAISYGIMKIYILSENFDKIESQTFKYNVDDNKKKEKRIIVNECDIANIDQKSLKNIIKNISNDVSVNYVKADSCNSDEIQKMINLEIDIIIVVADKSTPANSDNCDARTIKTLFQINHNKAYRDISIIAEILDYSNRKHAYTAGVNSVIISPITIGNYITQITREKEIKRIFEQLLSISGKEIYTFNKKIISEENKTFDELFQMLYSKYRVLLIGIINNKNHIELNPKSETEINDEIEELIVICKRETFEKFNSTQKKIYSAK